MKILGHEYKVEFYEHLDKERSATGECNHSRMKIVLDPTFPDSIVEETFLHEVFEAIKIHLGYFDRLPHEMITQLSETLYQVIKDNPEYFSIRVKKDEYIRRTT